MLWFLIHDIHKCKLIKIYIYVISASIREQLHNTDSNKLRDQTIQTELMIELFDQLATPENPNGSNQGIRINN